MSASLMVLLPLVLLAVVGALCFVGCFLDSGPYQSLLGPYQSAVIAEPSLVAFWPLNDKAGSTVAVDAITAPAQFNGTYMPPVTLGQSGIVSGDVPANANTKNTCVLFNGGFVQVGFQNALNPPSPFSIEAWVQPEWSLTDPGVVRIVVASDNQDQFSGYQLHATAENTWAASIGLGPGPTSQFLIAKPAAGSPTTVAPGMPTYLVATFDGTNLMLFVNGTLSAQNSIDKATMPGFQAMIFGVFAIGGPGEASQAESQSPFNGEIQDVAFYSAALDATTITNHFKLGMGG